MRRKTILLTIFMMLVLAISGCSSNSEETNMDSSEPQGELENGKITIEHSLGQAVVKKNPKNIIAFDYATLDTLDKMGVEIIGLPKSNIPTFLEQFNDDKYEDVGTLFEPNFEKIFELEPDVIFVSGRQAEVYDELAKIAPTVYLEVDGANYLDSVTQNLNILGEIFDKKDFVEKELAQLNKEVEDINTNVKEIGSNALVVMANDGAISAYGEGSRFGIVHKEFGFEPVDENIEVSNHGQNITFEYILEKNPDFILVVDRAATTGGSVSAEQIFDNEIIKQTNSYKDDTIIYLSSQVWYVASGGLGGTKIMIEDIQTGLGK